MKYSFKSFQFDCEQQILTQDGNILTLNEKPAQLLTLFLLDAGKIHKKSEILDSVWPDRVVTDQVVFQNISYLRSLFGSDAIKTFTRKGYQWQLLLTPMVEDEKVQTHEVKSPISIDHKPSKLDLNNTSSQHKNYFKAGLLFKKVILSFIALGFIVITWLWLTPTIITSSIPINSNAQAIEKKIIYSVSFEGQQLRKTQLATSIFNQTLFDSPYSSWQQHITNKKHLLVATKLYSVKDKKALRFYIQGEKHGWHDYILAENEEQAISQFNSLLLLLASSNYFSISSDHEVLAKLTILMSEQPANDLLSQQLIKQTFKLNDLDRATALIDLQLVEKTTLLRQGLLYLLKTNITMRNKQWSTAEQSISQALSIFQELKLPQLESRSLIESSWIYMVDKRFRLSMQVLNQAASKARESKEPLLEVNAHIIQSFIASKVGQTELALTQLDLAKEIIDLHQLSDEHQVPVQNNLAWIAKPSLDGLQHYQNILNMPFSPQYESLFHNASAEVRDAFIKQQEWDKAFSTIKPWQRSSFQALNRAHIFYAQNDFKQGLNHAKQAFRDAQVSHHKVDALNAALLILQNQTFGKQPLSIDEYDAFIKQNSTRIWLDQNKAALKELNKSGG